MKDRMHTTANCKKNVVTPFLHLIGWLLLPVLLFLVPCPAAAITVTVDNSQVQAATGVLGFYMEKSWRWTSTNDALANGGTHHLTNHNSPGYARWYPVLGAPNAGNYEVFVRWSAAAGDRDTLALYKVVYNNGGSFTNLPGINQQNNGYNWTSIGTYYFLGTNTEYVQVSRSNGKVSADAVKFVQIPDTTTTTTTTTSSTSSTSSTTSTTSTSTTSTSSTSSTTSTTSSTSSSTTSTTSSTTTTTTIPAGSHMQVSSHTMDQFDSMPINIGSSVAPQVLIAASKDHQLFYKAYDDYSDLDGDGIADTTFKPTIIYYGLFDSYKCYNYDNGDQRFEPAAEAGETYFMQGAVTAYNALSGQVTVNVTSLTGTAGLGPFNNWTITNLATGATGNSTTSTTLVAAGAKTFTTSAGAWLALSNTVMVSVEIPSYCEGGNDTYWSGNFLNWLSMSRIDSMRKILFGGHRRVDTATTTVLERAYLPHDAHSWAKYYNGADLAKLTPFIDGTDFNRNNVDLKTNGITFCNTTDSNGTQFSENVTDPPLIKVVRGNYSLWAGNERWQCTWDNGAPFDNHTLSRDNGNDPAVTGIQAYKTIPGYASGLGQKNYVARVQACVSGLLGHEKCKLYPGTDGVKATADDVYKPIGLLQVYGDDDQLLFGMIAGTYNKHTSGGEVYQNIGSISTEINVATDGTFKKVAATAGGPIGHPYNGAEGIVNAWSLFRIVGYDHTDGTYNSNSGDNCTWGLSAFADVSADNRCRNWGNPFSEIYFQCLRYLSDAGINGTFRSNASTGIAGLPTPMVWTDPLDATNYCARLNIVNFSSSIANYDYDDLDANACGVQEIWSAAVRPGDDTSSAMTDIVGAGEGIHGNQFFAGEINVDDQNDGENQLCTAKTVTNLGKVGGICPELPRLRGSYRIAGLAYYAHIYDIRSSELAAGRALTGTQVVDTYSVAASAAVPQIAIPHPISGGPAVTILPACRNNDVLLNPDGNCNIVDFKIVSQTLNNGAGVGTGTFYISWEDSEQGGDYDQDMWGMLTYAINANNNTIDITTKVVAESTIYDMGFGYVLAGTTNDGFHVHSGIEGFTYADTATITAGGNCADGDGCNPEDPASTAHYTLGASTAELLHDPLWYAAKWGGFQDINGDNTPDLDSEWDVKDRNGNPVPDGIPDNYFYATNPAQLEDALNRVFLAILQRVSSGTAAAVVSNNVRGEGALYQAYFEPLKKDAAGNSAYWVGTLHALWVDSSGNMREDNGDGALGNYNDDKVIQTYYDETEKRTRMRRCTSSDPEHFVQDECLAHELEDIHPLWNARRQMYYTGLDNAHLIAQRLYATTADQGRYIKTWIDSDRNGVVDAGEYTDFTAATINTNSFEYFDVATEAEADGIVNYVRGVEIAGFRNRTVDYDGDGVVETMRLGDIVNSTPTLVASPQEAFDLLYRDNSYAQFRQIYQNRRNVLYVGANDGLLHAFNAGFFNDAHAAFSTSGTKIDGTAAAAHPLGSELWAYAPMNLLSHLKWLIKEDYTHVYYVDAKPRLFDAKIFTADASHPNGWGTVMVVGMRLGGGAMTVDTRGDGLGAADLDHNTVDDRTFRSAYIIFDVTNPEEEPRLLAEFPLPDSTFTTVYPTPVTIKDQDPYVCSANSLHYKSSGECTAICTPLAGLCSDEDSNMWYLVFGSGPDNMTSATSTQNAFLYILDLRELTTPGITSGVPAGCTVRTVTPTSTIELISCDTVVASAFIGNPVAVDWDLDYMADMVYFGVVGSTAGTTGKMMRLPINEAASPASWGTPNTLLATDTPISAAATVGLDTLGNHWVFFGSGRFFADADKPTTATQYLYGLKDPYLPAVVGTQGAIDIATQLLDVTNTEIQTNGVVVNGPGGLATFTAIENDIDANIHVGWKLALPVIEGTAGTSPATRSLSQQALLGSILFTSVYQPGVDQCSAEGWSELYGQYFKTGTALPGPVVFTTQTITVLGLPVTISTRKLRLDSPGQATSPALHTGSGTGDESVSVFTQLSSGPIIKLPAQLKDALPKGKRGWRQMD